MELIRQDLNINFVGFRYKAFVLSWIFILLGLGALVWRGGLNLGVDFAGGTLIQVQFKNPTTPDQIREALKGIIAQSTVQRIGAEKENEYLLRTEAMTSEVQSLSQVVQESLEKSFGEGQVVVRRVEMVGPKVGHDLRQKALFAIYYSLLLISIYISGRFEFKWGSSGVMVAVLVIGVYLLEALGMPALYLIVGALLVTLVLCWFLNLPYALGAVLSLVHDVLITVGAFAITNKEFSLEVLAAVLTLVGFSLNDTIVIYDRIRENLKKSRKVDLKEVINTSVNQTLSRTILTSGTVFVVTACLFFLGGTVIHDFSFALLVGLVAGTYSTVYVASPLLIIFEEFKKKKLAPKGAGA